jgi:large subunit ribosomal protein L29
MTKAKDLRDQTVVELKALLVEKQRANFKLLNQRQKEKKLDKPHLLPGNRREIARILTVLTEKEGSK